MFNLIGSLLFGNRPVDTTSTETQTQIDNGPMDRSQVKQTSSDINPQTNDRSVCQDDWDIVDRCEEADKCQLDSKEVGVNTSIYQKKDPNPSENEQKSIFERAADDNDIILGSFFEKNENSNDDQERYKTRGMVDEDEDITDEVVAEVRNKDWLITPLPCLVSITASQRSISENAELENLLIEHPSMSVFVTATSTSIHENVMQSTDNEKKEFRIVKTQSEKRKNHEMTNGQHESPNGTLKRKGKKNKKSNNTVANKENVRALLFTDNKKSLGHGKALDDVLLTSKQLKRNNKNSAFKSNNVNMNQRKYHKLQQPIGFNNNL